LRIRVAIGIAAQSEGSKRKVSANKSAALTTGGGEIRANFSYGLEKADCRFSEMGSMELTMHKELGEGACCGKPSASLRATPP